MGEALFLWRLHTWLSKASGRCGDSGQLLHDFVVGFLDADLSGLVSRSNTDDRTREFDGFRLGLIPTRLPRPPKP